MHSSKWQLTWTLVMIGVETAATVGVDAVGVEALGIISGNCIVAGGVFASVCWSLLWFDEEIVIDRVMVGGFNWPIGRCIVWKNSSFFSKISSPIDYILQLVHALLKRLYPVVQIFHDWIYIENIFEEKTTHDRFHTRIPFFLPNIVHLSIMFPIGLIEFYSTKYSSSKLHRTNITQSTNFQTID